MKTIATLALAPAALLLAFGLACSKGGAGTSANADADGADGRPAVRYLAVDMQATTTPFGPALTVEIELQVLSTMRLAAPHVNVIAKCDGYTDKDTAFFSDLSHAEPGDRKVDVITLFDHGELAAAPRSCELILSLSEGSTPPRRYQRKIALRPQKAQADVHYVGVDMRPAATSSGPALLVDLELEVRGTMPAVTAPVRVMAVCDGRADQTAAFVASLAGAGRADHRVDLVTLFGGGELAAPPTSCELTLAYEAGFGLPERYCLRGGKTLRGRCDAPRVAAFTPR